MKFLTLIFSALLMANGAQAACNDKTGHEKQACAFANEYDATLKESDGKVLNYSCTPQGMGLFCQMDLKFGPSPMEECTQNLIRESDGTYQVVCSTCWFDEFYGEPYYKSFCGEVI